MARRLTALVLGVTLALTGLVALSGCRLAARREAAATQACLESVETTLDEVEDVLEELETIDEADLGF